MLMPWAGRAFGLVWGWWLGLVEACGFGGWVGLVGLGGGWRFSVCGNRRVFWCGHFVACV